MLQAQDKRIGGSTMTQARIRSFSTATAVLIALSGASVFAACTSNTAPAVAAYAYNTADELVVIRDEKVIARTQFKYTPKYRGAVWTLDSRYVGFIADDQAAPDDKSKRTLVAIDAASGSIRRLLCPYCTSLAPVGGSTMLISEEDPQSSDSFAAMLRADLASEEPPVERHTNLPGLTQVSFLAGTAEGVLMVGIGQHQAENYYLLNTTGTATFIGTRNAPKANKAGKRLLRGIRQVATVQIAGGVPAFAVSAESADPDNDCSITSDLFFASPTSKSLIDTDISSVIPVGRDNPLVLAHSIWWGSDGRMHAAMITSACDGKTVMSASGEGVPTSFSATTGEWALDTNSRWVQVSHDKLYSVQDLSADTRLLASGEPDYMHVKLYLEKAGRRTKLADDIVTIAVPVPTKDRQAVTIRDAKGVCAIPCRVTSQVNFEHPTWGKSTLVTTVSSSTDKRDATIAVVNSSGEITWKHNAGTWEELKLAQPPRDKTGHIFINFNPGRYDGVIILQPTADGFNFFETLPAAGEYDSRFYGATLIDNNEDGIYEVDKATNNCVPTCAEATITHVIYRWNGTDYVSQ
jgi:hypothetical protein